MAFVARFNRREGGGYDCVYGKGSKALSAVIEKSHNNKWSVTEGFGVDVEPSKKCGDVKRAWGVAAAAAYGDADAYGASSAVPPAPPPGPPPIRRSAPAGLTTTKITKSGSGIQVKDEVPYTGPVCSDCKRPLTGWSEGGTMPPCRCNVPNTPEYRPDFSDPQMWERSPGGKKLTPIGALDMVFHWFLRQDEPTGIEFFDLVRETLFRTTRYAEYRPERFGKINEQLTEDSSQHGPDPATADSDDNGGSSEDDAVGSRGIASDSDDAP